MEDRTLSETLSARQYLPCRTITATEKIQPTQQPIAEGHDDFSNKGQRKTPRSEEKEKRRGRPRVTSADDRRTQVRLAQRAYRLKKETLFRETESRLADLEAGMSRISDSLSSFYHMALESDVHITHPALFGKLVQTIREVEATTGATLGQHEETIKWGSVRAESCPVLSDPATFGYVVGGPQGELTPEDSPTENMAVSQSSPAANQPECTFPWPRMVDRPIGNTDPFTFSFNESSFSRRLHRLSLEHIYRLLTDGRSDPKEIYRVFRLVPCIQYKDRMIPYLRCLAWAGPNEALETTAVPFYCIGGAGTHYPQVEDDGTVVYPENMRLPRKILGTLPTETDGARETSEGDRYELLKTHGLDGTWLDCRDVEKYLEEMGVSFDEAHLSGTWKREIIYRPSARGDASAASSKGSESSPMLGSKLKVGSQDQRACSLDVEELLRLLLKNMIILGRAPGFRLKDVEDAFKSSVTMLAERDEKTRPSK